MSVVKDSVGSTFDRGDFTDGLAFLWSSLDLSPYAGALGRTPHKVILVDSAGKRALGYLGAVGAGETLGSEVLSNTTFEDLTGLTVNFEWQLATVAGGQTGNCLEVTNGPGAGGGVIQQLNPVTPNGLYKTFAYFKQGSPAAAAFTFGIYPAWLKYINVSPTSNWVQTLLYATAAIAENYWALGPLDGTIGNKLLVDTASYKRVTDPPNTGIHIVSSLNGTIRNWADKDTGFDPGTITTWSIENIGQVGIGSGLKRRRLVEFIPDGQNVRKRRVLLEPTKEEYDWLLTKKNPGKMTQSEFEKWRRQNPRT